jgi:pimeloyl-ACP methyl ester carboxylesterase
MARWICSRTMSFPHMIAMALLLVPFIAFTGRFVTAQNPVPMIHLPKLRLTRQDSRSRDSHISLLARAGESHPPTIASPDVISVQCPAEAIALDPAVTCGYLPVPMRREQPEKTEKIRIYFEIYLHSNSGPAQSAIVPNAGGPSLTTTGFRSVWLSLFAPNLDVHDLLLIDDRGRGMSGLLVCRQLQHGAGSSIDQEVADCAAQLGDDDSLYSTEDVAFDVDAVRAELGYDKLDYYGGSYGTMDASAYATRFGEHLRSMILDSPGGPPQLVPFVQTYSNAAVPREVRLDCLRSPTCSVDHPNPDAELDRMIRAVRRKPVLGYAQDANGNVIPVDFNEVVLNSIATNPNGAYLDTGELLAAAESLRRGDVLPLLRLGAEGFMPVLTDYGDPAFLSVGAYAATGCVDSPMPYKWSSPPQVRLMQYADAVSELPSDYFAPFSKAASTTEQTLPDRACLFWEEPSPPTPVVPLGATYPKVPTLAFNSDIDTAVSTELAVQTVNLFPNSTLLIVKDGMHEPVESNACAAGIATHFIETLNVGDTSCTQSPETVWPALGRFPLFARNARPAEVDPVGGNEIDVGERKAVTVTVATAIDALKRTTIGSGNGTGLRAGTFQTSIDTNGNQTTTLTDCAFAKDVTVNGTVMWGADRSFVADLTVSGVATAGGTLHVEGAFEAPGPVGNFKISGTLGGKNVAALVPEA